MGRGACGLGTGGQGLGTRKSAWVVVSQVPEAGPGIAPLFFCVFSREIGVISGAMRAIMAIRAFTGTDTSTTHVSERKGP